MSEIAPDHAAPLSHIKTIFGAPEGQDARILADRARALMVEDGVLVHIALDDNRVATLQDLLGFFAPDVQVIVFPAWDCLPYDRISPHGEIVAMRVAALSGLIAWDEARARAPRILLTTVNAVTQRVPPREIMARAALSVEKGARIDLARLQGFLQQNGYMRTDTVREAGEYAVRGGIIDLFPPGYDVPVRLDLFGDEVEDIRYFDPMTQRTENKCNGFTLNPATEFFLDEESIARFRSGYREHFGVVRANDSLYEAISAGRRYNGADHWLPLFYERMDTIFAYMPRHEITLDSQAEQARTERLAQIEDFYAARKTMEQAAQAGKKKKQGDSDVSLTGSLYHPLPPDALYVRDDEWVGALRLSPFGGPDEDEAKSARKGRDFGDVRAQPDGDVFAALRAYINMRREAGSKILIACYSVGSRERLAGMMAHAGFAHLKNCDQAGEIKKLLPSEIGMTTLALEHGFAAPDLSVITEQDILGDRLARKNRRRKKADNFLTEISALSPGDLVVHLDHGIGRFIGLETVAVGKILHDCLKLEYAGGDKLYVPVENIEILSRFGSDEGTVQLDRLGGAGWQARKAKAKKDLMIMADGLLKIAAARQLERGETFDLGPGIYDEFIARFPYQETDDQLRAIDDVRADFTSGRPMDRLVCGDVGFGKTEVAIRAAYIAAMNGVQVAVVVPTTLLARQHYHNFAQRFAHTSIRVDQLSRMVQPKMAEKTKDGLRDGTVNIVIGTHAILAKTIKFSNLGLVIVDEEQRFGVKQKERLKELRANVHVLTLTATPIPRTLQMALTGVRDMSVIATPPVDRLAIRTFVMPYDPVVVREALMREHFRGGQSFYVCPRIRDIQDLEEALRELVPELRVVAAHGQMSAQDLEDRMTAFYEGQYDVLLATNIIENGIDIARANTMIVHRADMFGLAQLYQIRGRIGRSKLRAYAYLTYAPNQLLTDQAQRRLEVMETLDSLGAGFQLASHDMDIRGAGNLLGDAQSGHIREIGVELYQQMLEEAVAAARHGFDLDGETMPDRWSPTINLGTSVLIPDYYVEDLNVRMSLYRRLSDLEDKSAIESFAAELIDRFGPIPDEVENLMQIVEIKQLCKKAGIDRVEAGPKGAVIGFHKDAPPDIGALMGWLQSKGGGVKLRPDQKLVAMRPWDNLPQRVKGVRSLMGELAGLVAPPRDPA